MSEYAIPVRFSKLLLDCSVGAIVRGPKHSMVVKDTRWWYRNSESAYRREIRYVDQVRSALGIRQRLCTPPEAKIADDNAITGNWIPAMRFPRWMQCPDPDCGRLAFLPYRRRETDEGMACECGKDLEQVRWVVVHPDGYMAEVPWSWIAHGRDKCLSDPGGAPNSANSRREPAQLRLVERAYSKLSVLCLRCKQQGRMPEQMPFPPFAPQQPWMKEPPAELGEEMARLVEVGNVLVHSPVTATAFVIPPESRVRKGTVVDTLFCSSGDQMKLSRARSEFQRRSVLIELASKYRCEPEEVQRASDEIARGYPLYGADVASAELIESEYGALRKPIPDLFEDEDFVTAHHSAAWKALRKSCDRELRRFVLAVDRLVEVRRLKEILVYRGFIRHGDGLVVKPDITDETGWLPALALRGEGVFFTLAESVLRRWETQDWVRDRARLLRQRHVHRRTIGNGDDFEVTPRFLLLHTLAHALIRQFESEAGYPAASLKERIYCDAGSYPMAGVLIYVAVPDEYGSLGGLVELATPRRFLRLLKAAIDSLEWCSMDPVCAGHEGQGPDLLNLAACQACALLPETSCQHGNVLLDRVICNAGADAGRESLLDLARVD